MNNEVYDQVLAEKRKMKPNEEMYVLYSTWRKQYSASIRYFPEDGGEGKFRLVTMLPDRATAEALVKKGVCKEWANAFLQDKTA